MAVTPTLLDALIKVESGGDPRAVSPKGAMGLAQAMPDTARDPGFGVAPLRDPFDPAESRRFAGDYLGAMLNRYGGDVRRSLVAYNWGPGNADKWDGRIESLPEETRNYIRAIETAQVGAGTMTDAGPGLRPVTDPDLLRDLEGGAGGLKPVTDPDLLRELEGGEPRSAPAVPEGMVFDPERNMYVDVQAEMERRAAEGGVGQRAGEMALEVVRGTPFVGEGFDELVGMFDPMAMERLRAAGRINERDRPGMTTAANVAGGVLGSIPLAFAAWPSLMASAPSSLLGQTAAASAVGWLGGIAEGLASGFLAGEGAVGDPDSSRMDMAEDRGALGGMFGLGLGAVSPATAKGLGNLFGYFGTRADNAALRGLGLSDDSAAVMRSTLTADGPEAATAAIRTGGPGAMIADAGPASRQMLDVAINRGGGGSRVARDAVEARATQAGAEVRGALDDAMGPPRGLRETAEGIAEATRPGRSAAYGAAYDAAIDYASDAGRAIEDAVSRIEPRLLRQAVDEANAEMRDLGIRNQQILIDVADDGGLTFREMPNVRQLDELKKALERLVERDEFGRITAAGLRPARQAARLRDALREAVPEYGEALAKGADKIAQDNGLRFGQSMLTPRVTREDVAREIALASPEAKRAMLAGARARIDEALANVRRTITDPNVDARQAQQAIKDLSSDAVREKLSLLLGEERAAQLLARVDRAAQALDLRAGVARNSATQPRQVAEDRVRRLREPGIAGELAQGDPVAAGRKLIRALADMPEAEILRREEAIFEELSRFLTERRGEDAVAAVQQLLTVMRRSPQAEASARRLAQRLTAAGALGAYQTGTRSQALQ